MSTVVASWPLGAPWLAGAPRRSQSCSSPVSPHHGHRSPAFSGPPFPRPCNHCRPPSSRSSSASRHLAHPLTQAAVEHILRTPCGRRRATPLQAAPTAGPGPPPPPRAADHHLPRVSCPDEPHPGAGLAKGVGKQGGRSHNFWLRLPRIAPVCGFFRVLLRTIKARLRPRLRPRAASRGVCAAVPRRGLAPNGQKCPLHLAPGIRRGGSFLGAELRAVHAGACGRLACVV
jgi:hypothetical protein